MADEREKSLPRNTTSGEKYNTLPAGKRNRFAEKRRIDSKAMINNRKVGYVVHGKAALT